MNRRTAALLVLAAAPLALAVQAPAWRTRLDAFEEKAAAERRRLGLDDDRKREALYARYPTPEVTFAPPAVVCPGATGAVRLDGVIPPGALVAPHSDAVQVVKERVTATGWEASVRVVPGAPPEAIGFEVVTPVSGASATVPALVVGCRHTWTLDVGGDTLVVTTDLGADEDATARGEWRRGGKVLGATPFRVTRGSRALALEEERSMEAMQASAEGYQDAMGSKAWKELDARAEAAMKKVEGCAKLPPEKMGPCFAGPQKEMEAVSKEKQAMMEAAERKGAPAFGCRRLSLSVKEGAAPGAVEGRAEECAGRRRQEQVEVSGRFTAP